MKATVADIAKEAEASKKAREAWTDLSESVRRRLLEQAVSEWARTTSMHGISKLTSSGDDTRLCRMRRIVWSLLLLGSLCILVYQLSLLFAHYLERPIGSRTVEIDAKVAQFPSVTLCPLNGWSRERVVRLKDQLEKVVGSIFDIGNSTTSSTSSTSTSLRRSTCEEKWKKVVSNMPSHDNFVASSMLMANSALTNQLLLNVSVPLQSILLDCSYYGRQCTPSDFVTFRNSVYGVCFAFNFNGSRQVTQAGASSSLQLTLALNQSDYADNGNGDAGFRILVHQPGTYPFAESRGHHVGPGVSVQIGVQFRQSEGLEAPYGTCRRYSSQQNRQLNWYVDTPIPNSSAVVEYSHAACSYTCQQRRLINRCNCYSPYAHVPADYRMRLRPCEIRTAMVNSINRCVTDKERQTIANECADECRFACSRSNYVTTISFAQFPSQSYLLRAAELGAASGFGADLAGATAAGSLANFARSNFLRVSIFAESLKLVRREQYQSYQIKDLLSDCGGQAGFWLGLSVLTVCEIFELLTQLCGGTLFIRVKGHCKT